MSSTLLEVTRAAHEEVEIYEDKDNARKDEIAALGGQTASGTNVFSAFYDRLKEIREYHRRHQVARVVDAAEEYEELLKEEPRIEFSGEEALGRYLDLHEMYNKYINSKFGEPIEYSTYLDVFSLPHKIPRNLKLGRKYKEYLENLLEYLIYFFQRTEPLQDLDRIFPKVETDFDELWTDGKVEGWESKGQENGHISAQHSLVDLDYYSTVEELTEVGPEKLKEALAALGLKTGGTTKQRAERLFLTKWNKPNVSYITLTLVAKEPNLIGVADNGVMLKLFIVLTKDSSEPKDTPLEQLDRKHFVKGSRSSEQNGSTTASQQVDNPKDIALIEAKIKKLCELLDETIVRTKENIEKKQALTYEEMEAEREEEEIQAESESDDEEQQIYNPLKLPMGWDGKPIPYWLYKLHGLGQEFKCEICGNHSYWGRRAFERHFKEWRHQHGMRCLGIPNTKNFNEITSIREAKVLWERIQERQGVNKWRPDLEEEYEDKEGNIYNKKTYTDLQRQGLI
ncbi:hypothetical protein HHK36_029144 [Tetracentron sinense]|uniref:Matrin-type domain-containing protein n=1 Tax=Tetracentron sinense TaxID=13715 RepID=A0A834YGB3_TETSI|nr:hypothetical protein HHK36_029144 [Tetracentron sinense]